MQDTASSVHSATETTVPLKMLLVEDSAVLAARLEELLTHVPGVDLASTVDTEAEAVAAITDGGIDVVILDLHLRQGTGFGVLRGIANLQRRPVIIVLTNYALEQYLRSASSFGVDHFLDKARDFDSLPDLLQRIAGSGGIGGGLTPGRR